MLTSIMNTLQQLNINQPTAALSFQKGKIFFGTVKNIYPNDFALVQIGKQNLLAQLEAAITNGESYWFQVDSDEGDIQLKLLSKQDQGGSNISAILKHLALPPTKENTEITSFLSKEQLPFNKDTILKINNLLAHNNNTKQSLNVIRIMLTKGFPLTESVFKSLLAADNPERIQNKIQLLEHQLIKEEQTPAVQALQKSIFSLKESALKPLAIKLIQLLTEETHSNNEVRQPLAINILQKMGVKLEEPSFSQSNPNENQKQQLPVPQHLPEMKPIVLEENRKNQELFGQRTISPKLVDAAVDLLEKYMSKDMKQDFRLFTEQEKDFFKGILESIKQSFSGKESLYQFKEITKSLGIFYESQILQPLAEHNQVEESLKPSLIKFLQESNHSSPIRDTAEALVNKMNGQQIQSYDNGPMQHLHYEIPINLFGYHTNVKMQWSGKKTEDGKIDPNYCHVLFFLDLEHIHETVVEMKVQNRVITVNVYNESTAIKDKANELTSLLKGGLEKIHYQLSAVHFIKKDNNPLTANREKMNTLNKSYTGVDIRV
ncbi:hypothetical protein [Bacillus sp. FJAT-49736]|uniref:hypothetical protein n=1 Tax=Bacillus sp. FJAT-49736 TaxID=2833582 RepID=UPI001BC9E5E3|nr:hypothetical protein [Bacillus sp. FJAT-49736]MBS4172501.1 hypothetical protein [Bacillus sp. FJAT-49736]